MNNEEDMNLEAPGPEAAGASVSVAAVAKAILAQNNEHFPSGPLGHIIIDAANVILVAAKGVTIHKIDEAAAQSLAGTFVAQAQAHPSVPLTFALGGADIESIFDPQCENGNFLGSNPSRGPEGYDVGVCQLKLRYLIGQEGIANVDEARAFALDPARAIPYFFRKLSTLIAWAQSIEAERTSAWNPKYGVLANATMAYNFGMVGAAAKIDAGEDVPHCDHVIDLERWFAAQLGVPSVMES